MKSYSKLLLLSACVYSMTACVGSEESTPDQPDTTDKVSKITFTPDLKGMSRATETAFETGDEISLFAVKPGDDESSVVLKESNNFYHNVKFVYDGSQFTSNPAIYKGFNDKLAYFAVYPYMEQAGPQFTFTVKADQSTEAAYKASDLCTASTGYTTESVATLVFSHRMSNLEVNLEGNNLAGGVKVEFTNALISADCNLNNLSFQPVEDLADVVLNEYGTNTWRAIVAPQTVEADREFLRVTVNDKVHTLKAPGKLDLASGKRVVVNLRILNEEIVYVDGDIYPWDTEASIDYIIPGDILGKLDDHIDIFYGNNPPNIEGCYLVDPYVTVYCEDENNGGYEPGFIVVSHIMRFTDQDMERRTVKYYDISVSGASNFYGNGAFISGDNNNFTVFFDTEGTSSDIYVHQAVVVSGTKTEEGIANLQYAFIMLEKGDDPQNILMDEGVYRVFKDGDNMSGNFEWPESFNAPMSLGTTNVFDMIMSNK